MHLESLRAALPVGSLVEIRRDHLPIAPQFAPGTVNMFPDWRGANSVRTGVGDAQYLRRLGRRLRQCNGRHQFGQRYGAVLTAHCQPELLRHHDRIRHRSPLLMAVAGATRVTGPSMVGVDRWH